MFEVYLEELKKIKLLEQSEEQELWDRVSAGCVDSRAKIIVSYQPLVFKEAKKLNTDGDICMELVQEGMVGLIESLERFDHQRGVAFSLFAMHRIRGKMLDYLTKETATRNFSLDKAVAVGSNVAFVDLLVDSGVSAYELVEEQLIARKLQSALERLPVQEKFVIQGIYLQEESPAVLAETINISLGHLYRLRKKGVQRIRGMLSRFIHEWKN